MDPRWEYDILLQQLESNYNISHDLWSSLGRFTSFIEECVSLRELSDEEDRYSKPMPWIGIYISLASLLCILLMVADLIHGIRSRKLWFPCKYFTVNATSLTVIAIAMKLPVDLNNPMRGSVDQGAKLGSMSFMCTMMANLLPSLATMNNKELNIIALGILVITLVVNVCIQVNTGLVSQWASSNYAGYDTWKISIVYVALLLALLIIHICTALTILKSKQILQLKYQAGHETALKDLNLQQSGRISTVEKLKKHVSKYWIMAGTGSPQFITACSATTSASGVICATSTALLAIFMLLTYGDIRRNGSDYGSDYKWSMFVILVIQFIGVIVGTIAPAFRCFADLSFKLSIKWIWNHIKVFKVESYWTQTLCDWKKSSIPLAISSRKSKIVVHNFKILILSVCIGFQKTVVVACKMIGLIPIFLVICVLLCIPCLKGLKSVFNDPRTVLDNTTSQHNTNINLSRYILQHQDDMEFAERTLKNILNSVDRLTKKAAKKQPNNLMKLLEGSSGFQGVELFDSHRVSYLLSEEPHNCWSLPVVTLTSIVMSLPNIQNNRVDSLLSSVSEGLVYVTLIEEILNGTDEYVSIQKAAKNLWLEVEVDQCWLGNKLNNPYTQLNTAGQILQSLKDTAKDIVIEVKSTDIGSSNDDSVYRSICANSMYRITETILLSYNTDIEQVSQEELFLKLSSMIGDITAACLTNLPQIIAMKCHESAIEKREASVHSAAQLLGETTQIINSLQDRELPSLNPSP